MSSICLTGWTIKYVVNAHTVFSNGPAFAHIRQNVVIGHRMLQLVDTIDIR